MCSSGCGRQPNETHDSHGHLRRRGGLCIGCGRRDASQDGKKNILDLATPAPAGAIAPVEVVGCLSASGDRFVLSHVDKENSKTVAYQLVNADDQLRPLVGREVRVTGEAPPTQKAETRAITPPAPAGAECVMRGDGD